MSFSRPEEALIFAFATLVFFYCPCKVLLPTEQGPTQPVTYWTLSRVHLTGRVHEGQAEALLMGPARGPATTICWMNE